MTALYFQKLRPEAILPSYGSEGAIGLDLCACGSHIIMPTERRRIPVGLAVGIPHGYYGRIAPRGRLSHHHGLDVLAGVIDADYRGELEVLLINLGAKRVSVHAGNRVAQLILERADRLTPIFTEQLTSTIRGDGRYGSTGL